jgi:hypothetical protein
MNKLTRNEVLTLAAAGGALVLSAVSFYYQFVEQSQELLASVLNLKVGTAELTADVALFNDGNRSVVVSAICAYADLDGTVEPLPVTVDPDQQTAGLPALLAAGVAAVVPVKLRLDVLGSGEALSAEIPIRLAFYSMDSTGKAFGVEHSFFSVRVNSQGWIGYTIAYDTIDLLESEARVQRETREPRPATEQHICTTPTSR